MSHIHYFRKAWKFHFFNQKFFNFRFETLQNKIWNTFTSLSGTRRPLCYPRLWNQPTEHIVALWKLPQAVVFSTLAVLPWYQLIPWLMIPPTLPYSSLQSTCFLKKWWWSMKKCTIYYEKRAFPFWYQIWAFSGQGLIPALIGRHLSDIERQIL